MRREAILLRFEAAWREQSEPIIEDFLPKEQPSSQQLLLELCKIDIEHHVRRGKRSVAREYVARFPELSDSNAGDELDEFAKQVTKRISVRRQMPRVGDSIRQYELKFRVGEGSFAIVFAAWDNALRRDVAIKVLKPTSADRQAVLQRMRREALAIASLQHPHIVPVYDAGSHAGVEFIVTRLVDGNTLEAQLEHTSYSPRESAEIAAQLAEALDTVHTQGIVHRDVKPSNVLMDGDKPLLFDFGLAHVTDASLQLTMEGDLLGTPAYMSPEQAQGKGWQVDQRSDIYSLGAVLFRLACHRIPFDGTMAEVVHQVIHRDCPDPTKLTPSIDRDLRTIILKCVAKEPTERYDTARDLANDLQRYLRGEPIKARPLGVVARSVRWSRRRPVIAGLLATSIILGAFFVGTATQLRQAKVQRDRAQTAESTAQALMAQASFDAGRLAGQRGQFTTAHQHFLRTLERNPDNRHELLLQLANTAIEMKDFELAEQYANRLQDEAGIRSSVAASLRIAQAELARRLTSELDRSVALFGSIELTQLPPNDQEYVRAQLANDSPAAVDHLQAACRSDPYDYRSRQMLILTLFSLARFDEALAEVNVARQLFDDADFQLLEGLIRTSLGQLEPALEQLNSIEPPILDVDIWQELHQLLHHITQELGVDREEQNLDVNKFAEISHQFVTSFAPLFEQRDWLLPARIATAFREIPSELESLQSANSESHTKWLSELTETHPEGSLFLVLGSLHLSQVPSGITDASNEIEHMLAARRSFRESKTHSRFVKETIAFAPFAEFSTSLLLAYKYNVDVQSNYAACAEVVREFTPELINHKREAEVIAFALGQAHAYEQQEPWIRRWQQLAGNDPAAARDAMIALASNHRVREQWFELLSICDQFLAEYNPKHRGIIEYREKAAEQLSQAIKAGSDTAE